MSSQRTRRRKFVVVDAENDYTALDVYAFRVWMHLQVAKELGRTESVERMALRCRMSATKFRLALNDLRELGLVRVVPQYAEDGAQIANTYELAYEEEAA